MPFVRLAAATAVVAVTAFVAAPAEACDDRFPWTCQTKQPASAAEPAARDANAKAVAPAPQAQRATTTRKARTARKSAKRSAWKHRSRKARAAHRTRVHTSEKKERTPHRPSISDKATEHEATAAADKISHSEDRAAAPGLAARPATEPSINPATRDPAFAGLRDPIAKPPPAPRAGPLTTAMLAPVSALPPTRFQPPPTMVDASQIAAPVEIATPNRDQPAKPAKLASIKVPREIAAVAQMPSEQHGGTWIQRMLMVLGGALAAAWTTRFMVA